MIAEDLGFLTDSVRELLAESGYPGMKVLSLPLMKAARAYIFLSDMTKTALYTLEPTTMRLRRAGLGTYPVKQSLREPVHSL